MGTRINQNGINLDHTCKNTRFHTDTTKGYPHFSNQTHLGSVTSAPLYDDGDSSLFLEYVLDTKNNKSVYWFMWYNGNGIPAVTMSSVIDEADIAQVIRNIAAIKL